MNKARLGAYKTNVSSLRPKCSHKDFSVEVEFMNNKALFTPEEISSAVLAKMKEIAQDYLGHRVSRAVITGNLAYSFLRLLPFPTVLPPLSK